MKHTPGPYILGVGPKHCFHEGNRVAVAKEYPDGVEVTIAEVWPTGDTSEDIACGKLFVRAPLMHDALEVLVRTPHIRSYLKANDPQALKQALKALGRNK